MTTIVILVLFSVYLFSGMLALAKGEEQFSMYYLIIVNIYLAAFILHTGS